MAERLMRGRDVLPIPDQPHVGLTAQGNVVAGQSAVAADATDDKS